MPTYTLGIAGEAQVNSDGSSRQEIISRCAVGQGVLLSREPDNPYDANAVAVYTLKKPPEQIGYLSRSNAEWVAEKLDRGSQVMAMILNIHEPRGSRMNYGVVLIVLFDEPDLMAALNASDAFDDEADVYDFFLAMQRVHQRSRASK